MRKYFKHYVLLALWLTFSVANAQFFTFNGIRYVVNDDGETVTVTYEDLGYNYKHVNGEVVIPETVPYSGKNYTVTAIGESAFSNVMHITSVKVPDTVTSIGDFAFISDFTSVTIGKSVKRMGVGVFQEGSCTDLYCYIADPTQVEMGGSMFGPNISYETTLHVLPGSEALYKEADQWCEIEHIVGDLVDASTKREITVGVGGISSERVPICSWWMTNYQGSQCLYLKDELQLQPGDAITALSYRTSMNAQANAASFEVRIINTSLSEMPAEADGSFDPALMPVQYNDAVYASVSVEPYGLGGWLTLDLSTPFLYTGENIIIDVRNTKPSTQSLVFFDATSCSEPRAVAWLDAADVAISQFNSYGLWVGNELPVTRVTYIPRDAGFVYATSLTLNKTGADLAVGNTLQLEATIEPTNVTINTLRWCSSDPAIATVDDTGLVTAVSPGMADITVETTDGSLLKATCTVSCNDGQERFVTVGSGGSLSEGMPICNWWMGGYQGCETIYLKNELGLMPGDQITALSYHCVRGQASGGTFNVRMTNTALEAMPEDSGSDLDDPCLQLGIDDKVYGTVTLDAYRQNDWITFPLSEPFVYDGKNILIDIRNTKPGKQSGWVYFDVEQHDEVRGISWYDAKNEAVDGFNYNGAMHLQNDLPVLRLSYRATSEDIVRATSLTLDKTSIKITVDNARQLVATLEPENVAYPTLDWRSDNPRVATVDAEGIVTANKPGKATITVSTTDGSNLTATCEVNVHASLDVNSDGCVDVGDVNFILDYILNPDDD